MHRRFDGLIDQHFARSTTSAGERRLWRHLPHCDTCRSRYRTQSSLEMAQFPASPSSSIELARQRMERSVFPPPLPGARAWRMPAIWGIAGLASVAAALIFTLRAVNAPLPDDGFRARGNAPGTTLAKAAHAPKLLIFRISPTGHPEPAGDLLPAGDNLAFAYVNPGPEASRFLMVFGIDAAGHVDWFQPAWGSAGTNPTALPIGAASSPVELVESVRHELPQGRLRIFALFAGHTLTVRDVEDTLKTGEANLDKLGKVWSHELRIVK